MSFSTLRSIWPYCAQQAISDICLLLPPTALHSVHAIVPLSNTIFKFKLTDGRKGKWKIDPLPLIILLVPAQTSWRVLLKKREKEIEPAPQNEKEVHLCLL